MGLLACQWEVVLPEEAPLILFRLRLRATHGEGLVSPGKFWNFNFFIVHVGGYQEVNLFPQSGGSNPLDSSFGSTTPSSMGNSLGDVLQPVATGPLAAPVSQAQPKRLTTDVDSSLAQAAANLSIELSGGGGGGGGGGGAGAGVFGVPPSSK